MFDKRTIGCAVCIQYSSKCIKCKNIRQRCKVKDDEQFEAYLKKRGLYNPPVEEVEKVPESEKEAEAASKQKARINLLQGLFDEFEISMKGKFTAMNNKLDNIGHEINIQAETVKIIKENLEYKPVKVNHASHGLHTDYEEFKKGRKLPNPYSSDGLWGDENKVDVRNAAEFSIESKRLKSWLGDTVEKMVKLGTKHWLPEGLIFKGKKIEIGPHYMTKGMDPLKLKASVLYAQERYDTEVREKRKARKMERRRIKEDARDNLYEEECYKRSKFNDFAYEQECYDREKQYRSTLEKEENC